MLKLRVWHVPQVPMKSFKIEVSSVEEAIKLMDTLAQYDLFQYENQIKPDYCNASGLQMYDETLTDEDVLEMELEDKWIDWYHESDQGYWDNPRQYLEEYKQSSSLAEESKV